VPPDHLGPSVEIQRLFVQVPEYPRGLPEQASIGWIIAECRTGGADLTRSTWHDPPRIAEVIPSEVVDGSPSFGLEATR
jgi:hypothetical protein